MDGVVNPQITQMIADEEKVDRAGGWHNRLYNNNCGVSYLRPSASSADCLIFGSWTLFSLKSAT